MKLPETYVSGEGLTVANASSDLLRELLTALDRESSRLGVPVSEKLPAGLSRSEIEDLFDSIGLTPPEELLVWWGWHNGIRSQTWMSGRDQIDLREAIQVYRSQDLGTEWYEWNPEWILAAGQSNNGMAVCCQIQPGSPLVRFVSPETSGTQADETEFQVVSLCTPVTWILQGIADGWRHWNSQKQFWELDVLRIPRDWRLTDLIS
jgi:hypothetical protein